MDLFEEDGSPIPTVETASRTSSKKIFEYVKLPRRNDEYSGDEYDYDRCTDGSSEDDNSEQRQKPTNISIDPIVEVKHELYEEDDEDPQHDESYESGTETHNFDTYLDAKHEPKVSYSKHTVGTRFKIEKPKDPDRMVCNFCKEIFIGKKVLEAHMRKHTVIDKPFDCTECGMSFKYMSVLRVHMRKHTGEKPFSCSLCDKTFCQKAYLDAHLKRHNGDKLYFCDDCNKTFITQAHLKRHLVTHIQGKTFICTECGEEGPSETCQSEQHSRSYFEERPFVCQICDKRFSMHSAMISHSRTHTGEKPFSCELCHKTFTQRSNLSVHMKTHTGEKKFKCQFCNIAYLYKVNLDRHVRRAHGENSSYTCKECGESFSWRSSLHLHVLSHTGKDPFKCDYCDKKYVLQKCLWVHMRTHSGSIDFKCEVCDKHFQHHSDLRKHKKTHKSKKSQIHVKKVNPSYSVRDNAIFKNDRANKYNESDDSVQKPQPNVPYQNEHFNFSIHKTQPNISLFECKNDSSCPDRDCVATFKEDQPFESNESDDSIQQVDDLAQKSQPNVPYKTQPNINLFERSPDLSMPIVSYQNENVEVSIQSSQANISFPYVYLQKDHSKIPRNDFYDSFEKQ